MYASLNFDDGWLTRLLPSAPRSVGSGRAFSYPWSGEEYKDSGCLDIMDFTIIFGMWFDGAGGAGGGRDRGRQTLSKSIINAGFNIVSRS